MAKHNTQSETEHISSFFFFLSVENSNGHVPIGQSDETESKNSWDWSSRHSKILIGSFISITSSVAWVAFSELVQDIFQTETFNAPFTLTYFFMAFLALLFPLQMCGLRRASYRPANEILRYKLYDSSSLLLLLFVLLPPLLLLLLLLSYRCYASIELGKIMCVEVHVLYQILGRQKSSFPCHKGV